MVQTSSLTSIDAISTPGSYYTASGSPVDTADTTITSSPGRSREKPPFRDAQLIPHELKQHCQINLEEELYLQAIQLFSGFLSDGNKITTARPLPPARIATPAQLALLNTLTIHPSFTSRAPERSHLHVAAHALAYLRGLLEIVGPVNANFRQAFAFSGTDRGSGRGKCYNTSSGEDSDSELVGNKYAKQQSIWRRASDFWSILGWAFQCASEHPQRWKSWKPWLSYMVEVLESDWDERVLLEAAEGERREQQGGSPPSEKGKAHPHPILRDSLIAGYLDDLRKQRKQVTKEVMRALMAFLDLDASADGVFYKEIFTGETTIGPRTNKRKRDQAVDIENDQFGDYLDRIDDFESEEENDASSTFPATSKPERGPFRRAAGGGGSSKRPIKKEAAPAFQLSESVAETIPLRLRIFRILSAIADSLPGKLCSVPEIYQMFSDRIRSLPLPTFKLFVGFHTTEMPDFCHVALIKVMADDLLPVGRPDPEKVDKETEAENGISLVLLVKCYLPFASNRVTVEDNARLSLVLESMLWHLYHKCEAEYSEGLRKAVEKGIKAREDKIRRKGSSSDGINNDKLAREVLERSTKSLRLLMDVWSAQG
ncbi:hypothetical protein QBC37DRAFT_413331 [Rhypophila decipiens]|uniref:Uncharacterized protein n=1 Tax=Rhypophila decipiens TaxID=261697 RepID=A0AAN7BEJ1_9PEZI|nr:hypothetical protein QBC37DRAFT_413331 [Rhypophila decipiens]